MGLPSQKEHTGYMLLQQTVLTVMITTAQLLCQLLHFASHVAAIISTTVTANRSFSSIHQLPEHALVIIALCCRITVTNLIFEYILSNAAAVRGFSPYFAALCDKDPGFFITPWDAPLGQ